MKELLMMRNLLLAAAIVVLASCASMSTSSSPSGAAPFAPEPMNMVEPWPYPFSSAVRVGNLLFLSGQIGSEIVNGAPKLVAGGIEPETKQTMENIRAILTKGHSSLDRVIKCSVMMADMAEWPKMNEIYATYFPGKKPARSAWGATGLALGARVEIECIALVK
jgi:reactive intermediate/imine deaminase